MAKVYEDLADLEEKAKKPGIACESVRDELLQCLLKSDCCVRDKNTPRECLRKTGDPSVPDECFTLRVAYAECRKSLLDMRNRFRGRKW